MTRLLWDQVGERFYETGVDRGVLYIPNNGVYDTGYAWNGLTAVTESPSGAEATPVYADNIKYLNLQSVEEFGGTIEAYTYPPEFAQCDGTSIQNAGVYVAQQSRKSFGLCYRTLKGNDVSAAADLGYKLHLVYGALAAPSEKAYATVNDTPEALSFSWAFTTTPVAATGLKNTALLTVDSTKVTLANLQALEDALYGTAGAGPRLPLPDEVIAIFAGTQTVVTPATVTGTSAGVITIPTVTGVTYRRADTNAVVTGTVTIATLNDRLVIYAVPSSGAYKFTPMVDTTWGFQKTT